MSKINYVQNTPATPVSAENQKVTITLSKLQYDAIEDSNPDLNVQETIQSFVTNWANGFLQNVINSLKESDLNPLIANKLAAKKAARTAAATPKEASVAAPTTTEETAAK